MLSTPVVLQSNQVKRTLHDHINELIIWVLNSLVVSKNNIKLNCLNLILNQLAVFLELLQGSIF